MQNIEGITFKGSEEKYVKKSFKKIKYGVKKLLNS